MCPPGLGYELSTAPKWLQEYTQELLNKSRALSSEKYQPVGQSSPQNVAAIKEEIDRLLNEGQKVGKFDIIPFSVTGRSQPIPINPYDLIKIIENEDFARKVYESTTGRHNISREELFDLKERAKKQYQFHLPTIRKLEQEGMKPENIEGSTNKLDSRNIHNIKQLQERRLPLEAQKKSLFDEEEFIHSKLKDLRTEAQKMASTWSTPSGMSDQERAVKLNLHNQGRGPYPDVRNDILYADKYKKLKQDEDSFEKALKDISSKKSKIEAEIQDISSALSGFSDSPDYLFRRASIEREVRNLQKQRGLIAPMNEIHDRAVAKLERSFDDDTMKLASDELREARNHNELRSVEPLVQSSISGPTDEYMNKYVNDYTKDIRKALEDESEEQYLKEIAPKINMSFAQMGGFHSGARAKALRDSLAQQRTKLHRELAHLTGHARDKAMEHHELQRRREQSAADIIGRAVKSEKESGRNQAESLRHHAVTKHGMTQLDVAALGQVAKAKQEQEQHEIDVARHEHQRQLMYPQEQLAREAALLSGLPPPPSQAFTGTLSSGPQPPNLLTIGAGALSSLASNFAPQHQRTYKEGGSVRKNYADGGSVGSEDIGKELRNIIHEHRQADKEHLAHASHYNPFESMLRHVGNEMLANPGEDPLLSMGRGLSASMDHKDVVRQRAANLYDKI